MTIKAFPGMLLLCGMGLDQAVTRIKSTGRARATVAAVVGIIAITPALIPGFRRFTPRFARMARAHADIETGDWHWHRA